MNKKERFAGIAIFVLCMIGIAYNIFSNYLMISYRMRTGIYTALISYIIPDLTLLLIGIFSLPFFSQKRKLLAIPFGIKLLNVLLAGGGGYFFTYLLGQGVLLPTAQMINRIAGVLLFTMLPICFILLFGLKKNVTTAAMISTSVPLFFEIISNILLFTIHRNYLLLVFFLFFTIISYLPFYLLILFVAPYPTKNQQDGVSSEIKYRNKTTAIILSVLLGGWGVDRFYLGYSGLGVVKLLTAGGFGVWSIIDLIMICTGSLKPADGYAYKETAANRSESNPPASQGKTDPAAEIKKLYELYQQGILTEEEYNSKKTALLERI